MAPSPTGATGSTGGGVAGDGGRFLPSLHGAESGPAGAADPGAPPGSWRIRDRSLSVDGPLIMGILNFTPDSFSDGGEIEVLEDALRRAEEMVESGAGILDVGGESTRPGARTVPVEEELGRILPFIREARTSFQVPISVDTRKAAVARAVLDEGVQVVNDVSGLAHDPEMAEVVAGAGVGLVLMHMRGDPSDMRAHTDYRDVTREVMGELEARLETARGAGIEPDRIVVDPGIGFAKTAEQSLTLLRELGSFRALGRPILVGPSRKSFLGHVLDLPPRERVEGTVAACVGAFLRGARIFRVHDVEAVARALAVAEAVESGPPVPAP